MQNQLVCAVINRCAGERSVALSSSVSCLAFRHYGTQGKGRKDCHRPCRPGTPSVPETLCHRRRTGAPSSKRAFPAEAQPQ